MSGPRYKNISGQKFNKLTVIKPTFEKANNGSMIWECVCDCGNKTTATYSDLKRGHKKSCGCAIQEYIESLTYDLTNQRFGMLVVQYSSGRREKDKRNLWHCKCDCGNECDVDVNSLISGHTQSCGCFHKSLREQYVESILLENNFAYVSQYTFKDCKNVFCLPFDFYLPEYNCCIEYDGEQHFRPVDFFGGEEGFRKRKINDAIKTQYCVDHGIQLIRIPYTTTENDIKKIILSI
jgi:very-short-patch-repair endonuclease